MELKTTELKQLNASKGMVIIPKLIQYNEEGLELPRYGAKTIYLAINANPDDYTEVKEKDLEEYNKPLQEALDKKEEEKNNSRK